MANYNVYLSSTFRDLEEYRKAILELFRYISDDFTITAMEGYTAEDTSALEKCISDVEKCDIYILLLANRYGHIPKNNERNQNPNRKSITHLEFETAMNPANRKKVLVYLADIKNKEGFVFPGDEEGPEQEFKKDRLLEFREYLSENRLSPKPFVKPADLTLLVSASLINLIMNDPSTRKSEVAGKLNENYKYCCDRNKQFIQYEQKKIGVGSDFHVFVTQGINHDSGGNLVNRCAFFTLGLNEQDIKPLTFAEFYNSNSADKNSIDFFYVLQSKLMPGTITGSPSATTLKEVLTLLPGSNFIFKLTCEEEFLTEDKIAFLAVIFEQMYKVFSNQTNGKKIYLFINIEDKGDEQNGSTATSEKLKLLQKITASVPLHMVFLDRFNIITKEHIEAWLENYFTRDEWVKDELYDVHFSSLPSSFRMKQAEKSIRDFYKRIRDNDSQIINILNR